jgi:hypothetical protein
MRLEPAELCQLIESKRALTGQEPIDRSVMTTRCGIAFTIARKRWLNLKQSEVEVDAEDLDALAEILEERFNIAVHDRDLLKLCVPTGQSRYESEALQRGRLDRLSAVTGPEDGPGDGRSAGVFGWLRRMFRPE